MDDMTTPAVLRGYLVETGSYLVLCLDPFPEMRVAVGKGRPVASVAITLFPVRVAVSFDAPGADSVALPAVLSKQSLVWIEMALAAGEVRVQQGVVHAGNGLVRPSVLGVAFETARPFLVESERGAEPGDFRERVAEKTVAFLDTLPGDMAVPAFRRLRVERPQWPGLCGLVPEEESNATGNEKGQEDDPDRSFHGSHRRPQYRAVKMCTARRENSTTTPER